MQNLGQFYHQPKSQLWIILNRGIYSCHEVIGLPLSERSVETSLSSTEIMPIGPETRKSLNYLPLQSLNDLPILLIISSSDFPPINSIISVTTFPLRVMSMYISWAILSSQLVEPYMMPTFFHSKCDSTSRSPCAVSRYSGAIAMNFDGTCSMQDHDTMHISSSVARLAAHWHNRLCPGPIVTLNLSVTFNMTAILFEHESKYSSSTFDPMSPMLLSAWWIVRWNMSELPSHSLGVKTATLKGAILPATTLGIPIKHAPVIVITRYRNWITADWYKSEGITILQFHYEAYVMQCIRMFLLWYALLPCTAHILLDLVTCSFSIPKCFERATRYQQVSEASNVLSQWNGGREGYGWSLRPLHAIYLPLQQRIPSAGESPGTRVHPWQKCLSHSAEVIHESMLWHYPSERDRLLGPSSSWSAHQRSAMLDYPASPCYIPCDISPCFEISSPWWWVYIRPSHLYGAQSQIWCPITAMAANSMFPLRILKRQIITEPTAIALLSQKYWFSPQKVSLQSLPKRLNLLHICIFLKTNHFNGFPPFSFWLCMISNEQSIHYLGLEGERSSLHWKANGLALSAHELETSNPFAMTK